MGHLSERQKQLLHVMGIRTWQKQTHSSTTRPDSPPVPVVRTVAPAARITPSKKVDVSEFDWQALQAQVASCQLCELCESRTNTVFGVGARNARWMFIGEAPGAEEDRRGEPFVGAAGKLLDAMMMSMGLDRSNVYIANLLKCRPPGNRDPKTEEANLCLAYLQRQIALVNPGIIVAVGRIAAQKLLTTGDSLARLRGKVHHYGAMKTPMIVTYHPAYLIRSPSHKRMAWEDLLMAGQLVGKTAT